MVLPPKNDFNDWLEINKDYIYKLYAEKYPEDFKDYAFILYKLDREVE